MHIGIAEQESVILNESMWYNINFGASNEGCLKVLNMDGLAARASDNPANYSGGEKKKLSIMRLLFKDPEVMIFDEPTSAMDAGTIERFAEHLHDIKKNKIIIIITHDSFVQEICDEIMTLSKIKT